MFIELRQDVVSASFFVVLQFMHCFFHFHKGGGVVPTVAGGCSAECRGWKGSTGGRFRSSLKSSVHRSSVSTVAVIGFPSLLIVPGRLFDLLSRLPMRWHILRVCPVSSATRISSAWFSRKVPTSFFRARFISRQRSFVSLPHFVALMHCSISSNVALEITVFLGEV